MKNNFNVKRNPLMGWLWGVALSVLGITIHNLSQDKKTAAGDTTGMITGIIRALRK
jgi:hypothetical protein